MVVVVVKGGSLEGEVRRRLVFPSYLTLFRPKPNTLLQLLTT